MDAEPPLRPGTLNIDVERPFEFNGRRWILDASPLAVPYSLSTHLSIVENQVVRPFLLDWHDIVNEPTQARMHMYPGAKKDVSFDEKLKRMENLCDAIPAYDSLMTDVPDQLSAKQIEDLVNSGLLPRIQTVVLDTGTHGLRRLFEDLQFPTNSNREFVPTWNVFVEKATSGDLLRAWRALKGK